MTAVLVPARFEPGMFSNERVAHLTHLDGESAFFIQDHFISQRR